MARDAVIVGAVRTPIGKRNGALRAIHPVDLSAHVLGALAGRTGIDPGRVDDVIWGCVSQVGEQTYNVGRSAVLAAGWPERVPDAAPACDWTKAATWEFFPLDHEAFPAVELARHAGQTGGCLTAVYNAANEEAAAAFLEGSKKPGALVWMKVMAAKISAEGKSYETSLFLWNDIYQTTSDPQIKENALKHLRLLKVREDCKQLDALADQYEKQVGQRPIRMGELVQAGLLPGIPGDPLGYAYVFGPEGKAELNLDSPLVEQQLQLGRFE